MMGFPHLIVGGRESKGVFSFAKENTPFFWQQRKELHELMQRRRRCTPHPPRGRLKRDTLFGKRIPPLSGSGAQRRTIHAAPLALHPPSPAREIKRDTLFEKRIPPLPGSSAKSCTNSCSAVGAAPPHPPRRGEAKGIPLREENTPFFRQQRKELHELMQRQRRCNHPSPRREIKGDTLFGKRRNPCNIKVSQ